MRLKSLIAAGFLSLVVAGVAAAAMLAPPKVSTKSFEGTVPGATGSGASLLPGSLTLNGQCGNDSVAIGAGYKLPQGGINVTRFGWTGINRFQIGVANFNAEALRIALIMYCLQSGLVTKELAHFLLQLAPGAEGSVTKRCRRGFQPLGAYWDLPTPYIGLRDSYAMGGDGWMFGAKNQHPTEAATVEGDLVCVKGKGKNKIKVTYRPGSGGGVPGKTGNTPGTGMLQSGMCTANEVAVGGGFKGLRGVEITGMELTNAYQGITVVNYGVLALSNSNALGSCLGKG